MSNEKENINRRRTARILTVACGLLFSIFSFTYLAIFQKEVMEALHYSLAQGKTVYAPWMTAFLLTVVLLLIRTGINAWVRLRGLLGSLSYFPSCLLLGVLTDVGHGVYHGEGIDPVWLWLLPLMLVLYVVIGKCLSPLSRMFEKPESDGTLVTNSNLGILFLLCIMTACIGNTNVHFHHELQVEEALRKQDYEKALKVGEKQMDPSRNLTALRAYAMSREGSMGEHLFHYPQLYGAAGLLMGVSDDTALRLNADSLYTYLGDAPKLGEPALNFFHRICEEETGNYTTLDYYLSALLLEKKLDEFMKALTDMYQQEDTPLPKYYQEAYYLYNRMHPDSKTYPQVADEEMDQRWETYTAEQTGLAGTVGEGNRMRRKYGDTYWWYYQYR